VVTPRRPSVSAQTDRIFGFAQLRAARDLNVVLLSQACCIETPGSLRVRALLLAALVRLQAQTAVDATNRTTSRREHEGREGLVQANEANERLDRGCDAAQALTASLADLPAQTIVASTDHTQTNTNSAIARASGPDERQ